MKTFSIGGDRMPAIGLGTYRMKGAPCEEAVAAALDLGYRHIDTAERYDNEAEIGRALARSGVARDELWITSKVWLDNLTAEQVIPAAERSLDRLGLGQMDLLLVHWPPRDAPLAEVMAAMGEARRRGLTRHIGVSNFTPNLLERAVSLSETTCNQVECHPYLQQRRMLAMAGQLGLVLTAYCPLARGRVTRDATIERVAARRGATPAQVALAWLLARRNVAAIPRSGSRVHLAENLGAVDIELTREDINDIDTLNRNERFVDPEFAPAWGQ